MSTRQLLNMTIGAFALLLLAAIGIVFSTTGSQEDQNARIDLAVRQQILIQDLTREIAVLTEAEDRASVAAARDQLAQTIVHFDRNLTTLLHGGENVDSSGQTVVVGRTGNDLARVALEDGARLWIETGMPLADLAAGEFSIFSAAGQNAVRGLQTNSVELMQQMGTAANSLRMGLHARATIAGIARWAAAGLALVVIGLGFYRRQTLANEVSTPVSGAAVDSRPGPAAVRVSAQAPTGSSHEVAGLSPAAGSFVSPVNFDSVSASVDQMSVDMNTIAGSTEKMRLAIDSVGNALQGMLYSLNEMAQDTAEGHRIVRNANNAASFTASAAGDLASSAREMAAVVTRVTQLAQKTKQVATQIDGEAVHTGKTGEAFTSVVAGEVKGLSLQTNQATREIEDTVAGILATARQYEEAIGQIIKNISAINRVSENLGELMLNPPPRVEPGTPPPAPTLAPLPTAAAPEPVPAPAASEPIADDPVVIESTPDEVAAETASAIEDAVETAEPTSADDEDPLVLGNHKKDPTALNIPAAEDDLATEPEPEIPGSGSDGNVFMLGGPKKKAPAEEPAVDAETPDPPADQDAPEAPASDDDGGENVFMLNKPQGAAETDIATEPEVEAAAQEPADEVPAADTPTAESEPETDPAGDGESHVGEGSNANIFMLNKPK